MIVLDLPKQRTSGWVDETAGIYSLPALEARRLRWRSQQGQFLLRLWERICSMWSPRIWWFAGSDLWHLNVGTVGMRDWRQMCQDGPCATAILPSGGPGWWSLSCRLWLAAWLEDSWQDCGWCGSIPRGVPLASQPPWKQRTLLWGRHHQRQVAGVRCPLLQRVSPRPCRLRAHPAPVSHLPSTLGTPLPWECPWNSLFSFLLFSFC